MRRLKGRFDLDTHFTRLLIPGRPYDLSGDAVNCDFGTRGLIHLNNRRVVVDEAPVCCYKLNYQCCLTMRCPGESELQVLRLTG